MRTEKYLSRQTLTVSRTQGFSAHLVLVSQGDGVYAQDEHNAQGSAKRSGVKRSSIQTKAQTYTTNLAPCSLRSGQRTSYRTVTGNTPVGGGAMCHLG